MPGRPVISPIVWPLALTTARLLLAPLIIWLARSYGPDVPYLYAAILLFGVLSDIFDGVLARRFGVSRSWLRRYDSLADVAFYVAVLYAAFVVSPQIMRGHRYMIVAVIATELLCILFSVVKFRRLPATHTYFAKLYGLLLFLGFLCVFAFNSGVPLAVGLVAGLAANAEVLLIIALMSEPPVDVLSVFKLLRPRAP